jgi:excisionase family DNA binding protein
VESQWLTVREAVSYLKVARSTLYRWAREGRVRFYRLGEQTVRVNKNELDSLAQPASTHQPPRTLGTLVTSQSAIWKLTGIAEGPSDLAVEHDRYLGEARGRAKR